MVVGCLFAAPTLLHIPALPLQPYLLLLPPNLNVPPPEVWLEEPAVSRRIPSGVVETAAVQQAKVSQSVSVDSYTVICYWDVDRINYQ